jgi:hypothetical protein
MFRPDGWIEAGRERLDAMRPIARRHELTMLQLACAWDLAQIPVRCVAPTLIQEPAATGGPIPRPIEDKRAELAAAPALIARSPLSPQETLEIREIGENSGCMALKGANPAHEGPARPDRWELDGGLADLAGRWGIDPARDLIHTS